MFNKLNYSKQYQAKLLEEKIERIQEEFGDLVYDLVECETYNKLDELEKNIQFTLSKLIKAKEELLHIKQGN